MPNPLPADVAETAAAFARGMAECEARQSVMADPMAGAVAWSFDPSPWQPYVQPEKGAADEQGVT